ncbi:hypothetical protein B0O99DRAFT_692635 [Bisporella sp. PMI_857]|nr:hypothetical protein B0O99DRAFT_692635 [Bisporella sp. PMI_857]
MGTQMDLSYMAAPWAPVPSGLPLKQLMTPSGKPPTGSVPNFHDPASMHIIILTVCGVMIALTSIFVALRLWAVMRVTHTMGIEDYVCIIATISSFGYAALIMWLAKAARHMYDVPYWWFNDAYWKERYVENTMQTIAFPASRSAFFLLYIRVFGKNNKPFRIACYVGIVWYSLSYLLFIPLNAIYCAPSWGHPWASHDMLDKCERLIPFAFFLGACNIIGDLYIIILPLPIIARLHMTLEKKLGVMAIFLTGIFVLIASAISMFYRYRLVHGHDTNWYEGSLVCATVSELCVAIIASCMPSLSSLFKHHFKDTSFMASFRSAFSRRTNGSSAASGSAPKFAPWSGYKDSNKGSFSPSSNGSSMLKSEHSRSESQSRLHDHRYVELNDVEAGRAMKSMNSVPVDPYNQPHAR